MNYYAKSEDKNIQTYVFVILYSPLLSSNISYVLIWSGYNPLLSLECNNNKHIQLQDI